MLLTLIRWNDCHVFKVAESPSEVNLTPQGQVLGYFGVKRRNVWKAESEMSLIPSDEDRRSF